MKAERLLSVLLLLQAHGKLPGRALAERLAVSERTVHRDMEALRTWCRVRPAATELTDRDGWITLRVEFEDEAAARFVILGLGPTVDVIEPASLKARVKTDVAAMFARVRRRVTGA